MSLRTYRTYQALVMGGLGIFLLSKVMDGRILFYINQRFVILVLLAALGLIILSQLVLRERPNLPETEQAEEEASSHHADHSTQPDAGEGRRGWVLWLVALPLLIGVLVPERPLGASALQNRGVNTTSGVGVRGGANLARALPPQQRTVLDWIRLYNEDPDLSSLEGQPVDVTGFVYHDIRLPGGQFLIGRFTIACCVADAVALGMVVEGTQAGQVPLPDNSWVRVRGTLGTRVLDGKRLPLIQARQVEPVPMPEQPYLFP